MKKERKPIHEGEVNEWVDEKLAELAGESAEGSKEGAAAAEGDT